MAKHSYGRKVYCCIKAKAFLLSGHTRASYGREPYVTQLHDLQRFPQRLISFLKALLGQHFRNLLSCLDRPEDDLPAKQDKYNM